MWAAWWTAAPSRDPFQKPDAFHGGARTRAEALAEAERAAGAHLIEIEARWARAWGRVLVGEAPWTDKKSVDAAPGASRSAASGESPRASVWAVLGVGPEVTASDLKRAFRKRALERHPDHGGTAEAFRELQRAYEEAQRRIARPRRRAR